MAVVAGAIFIRRTPTEQPKVAILPASTPTAVRSAPPTPVWVGGSLAQPVPVESGVGIAVVGVDGSAPRILASGFTMVERLVWSPDHLRLAFAAQRDGNWDIYVVASDGSDLRRLTDHPAYDGDPSWSPGGDALAFASYRDLDGEIYILDRVPAGPADAASAVAQPRRLTNDAGPDIEPSWSGDDTLAFAAFRDGAYRIDTVRADGSGRSPYASPPEGADLRSPAWSPAGGQLAALEVRHGAGRPVLFGGQSGAPVRPRAIASSAEAFAWHPGGEAIAYKGAGTDGATVARGTDDVSTRTLQHPGTLDQMGSWVGAQRHHFAWSPLVPDPALGAMAPPPDGGRDPGGERTDTTEVEYVGLEVLGDVDVSGPRINASLAPDFAELRAEVAAGTGRDFFGRMSDMWRPLTFFSSASAYFSWHKTGRAFDTAMEFRGADGGPGMVLVREDLGGRTYWRMYLKAAAQDGSIGRPLHEPGWSFSAGGGGEGPERDGGQRARSVPDGYWLDFTATAGRHGWRRIPSLTRSGLDWRIDWAAIEYWHYERRDGLSWFEAALEVYSDTEVAAALDTERLEAAGISARRRMAAGVPAGWRPEG